jgi:hypothetical protein
LLIIAATSPSAAREYRGAFLLAGSRAVPWDRGAQNVGGKFCGAIDDQHDKFILTITLAASTPEKQLTVDGNASSIEELMMEAIGPWPERKSLKILMRQA